MKIIMDMNDINDDNYVGEYLSDSAWDSIIEESINAPRLTDADWDLVLQETNNQLCVGTHLR